MGQAFTRRVASEITRLGAAAQVAVDSGPVAVVISVAAAPQEVGDALANCALVKAPVVR